MYIKTAVLKKVIARIKKSQGLNERMQLATDIASDEWHRHEDIDDELDEALTLLGD